MKRFAVGALALVACSSSSTPPAPVSVPVQGSSSSAVLIGPPPANDAGAAHAWPAAVDTRLPAPDGFHLIAASKDGKKVLVEVTGMSESVEHHPGPSQGKMVRGSAYYFAELDVASGCFEATYDFPTLGAAKGTGTAAEALAFLNRPEMASEIAAARKLGADWTPNWRGVDHSGIIVTALASGGEHVVLEANDELFMAKSGAPFKQVGNRASIQPTLSANGKFVLFGSIAGPYWPHLLNVATGVIQRPKAVKGAAMGLSNAFALPDGSFLAVESPYEATPSAGPSKICAVSIDPEKAFEAERVCVPTHVTSSSSGVISQDARFLAIRGERPDRVVAFDTATWKIVTDVPGRPIYPNVDARGRIAWDGDPGEIKLASGTTTGSIKVAGRNGSRARLVGFIGDRLLVGHPTVKAFESEGPLHALKDFDACGYLTTMNAP